MAEKKTRILLRSDVIAKWLEFDPVLIKGELAICYDPSVQGERVIKIKAGDGVSKWSELPFISDYDAVINEIKADIDALELNLNKKVEKELTGTAGKSFIFNEADGGGVKFEGNNGVNAYVGVHDNIGGEIGTQIYVDQADGQGSTIIDVTQNGAYYTKGAVLPGTQRDVEANEIATKGVVDTKIAAAIGQIKHWSYKVVEVLPEVGEENVIYLVPKGEGKVGYKEYIWLKEQSKYELIGDTDIDLSEYRKAADQDAIDDVIRASIVSEISRATTEEAKKLESYIVTVNGKAGQYVGPANVPVYFELDSNEAGQVVVKAYNVQLNTEKEQVATTSEMVLPYASEVQPGLLSAADYAKFDNKQEKLPEVTAQLYDKYLHTNAITGELEWVFVEQGSADWGHIGGSIEAQTDLMGKFDAVDTKIDEAAEAAQTYIDSKIEEVEGAIEAEETRAKAEEAKKVDKEVQGTNGTAYIFNERDGGGAKFVNKDGVESFVGVNDGGENGLVAQIYADKLVAGKWQGAKLDVTNGAMYYTVGDKSFAERAVEENEIATKKDVAALSFDILDGGDASDWE